MNAPSGNGGGLILGEPADVKGRRLAGGLPWLLDMDLTNRVRLGDTVAGGRSGISAPVVPYGGFGIVDRTVSGTVTVTVDDAVLRCDTSAAGVTLNLPAAASMIDQVLEILKLSPLNTISIDPSGAETIGGQATLTVRWALSPVRIRSNGTSWDILEKEELAYDFNIEDNPAATNTGAMTTLNTSAPMFFSGRPVLFTLAGSMMNANGSNEFMQVNFLISIDGAAGVKAGQWTSNIADPFGWHFAWAGNLILTPTRGNHTVGLQWQRVAGAGTATMDFNDFFYVRGIVL